MSHPRDARADAMPEIDGEAVMFDLAPVSLWLEDYSEIKALFDDWRRAGVSDLRAHLSANPRRIKACAERIRILKVNRRTLGLYQAADQAELMANLGSVIRDDALPGHMEELVQLWDGREAFSSHSVNYTLSGQRLDIQLRAAVMPGFEADWRRILIAVEDVTAREEARRQHAVSAEYARGLFEHSPVSLWVEDFSAVKRLLEDVRERGITDFRVFTDVHPEFVERCMSEIRVIDVNSHTLQLFQAPDKPTLLARLTEVFRDDMHEPFREQLIDLWNDKLFQQREVVNYALDGNELQMHLQFSVLPGYEHDWSLVQVALTDITARKKAEAYLEYLGKHDVLTKLYNRSFYVDELNRLERRGPFPITVVVADLNGLKAVNDQWGHAAGDALLRRVGEVLNKAAERPCHAARIGGDEFVILMPGADAHAGAAMIENIEHLVELNNSFYPGVALSLCLGAASAEPGERLETVVKRADLLMYEAKRSYYVELDSERRAPVPSAT